MKKFLTIIMIVSCCATSYAYDQYQIISHGLGKNKVQERVKKYYVDHDKIVIEEDQMLIQIEDQVFSITMLYKDEKGFYVLKRDIDVTVQIKEHKVYSCRDCNMKFRNENSFYRHKIDKECSAQIRRERERRREEKERNDRCGKNSEFTMPNHSIPNHTIPNHYVPGHNISVPR